MNLTLVGNRFSALRRRLFSLATLLEVTSGSQDACLRDVDGLHRGVLSSFTRSEHDSHPDPHRETR